MTRTKATVDAAEVLARVEGRTDRTAARMCGVVEQTIQRWRATGQAAPSAIARAAARLDSTPHATHGRTPS